MDELYQFVQEHEKRTWFSATECDMVGNLILLKVLTFVRTNNPSQKDFEEMAELGTIYHPMGGPDPEIQKEIDLWQQKNAPKSENGWGVSVDKEIGRFKFREYTPIKKQQ